MVISEKDLKQLVIDLRELVDLHPWANMVVGMAADVLEAYVGPRGRRLPVEDDKTLPFEKALAELIDKIDSGLDTGDILEGARLASVALDAIMTDGDLVSNAHDYFRDTDRYETSVDFRIGWNACLDAIGRARSALGQPAEEGGKV